MSAICSHHHYNMPHGGACGGKRGQGRACLSSLAFGPILFLSLAIKKRARGARCGRGGTGLVFSELARGFAAWQSVASRQVHVPLCPRSVARRAARRVCRSYAVYPQLSPNKMQAGRERQDKAAIAIFGTIHNYWVRITTPRAIHRAYLQPAHRCRRHQIGGP